MQACILFRICQIFRPLINANVVSGLTRTLEDRKHCCFGVAQFTKTKKPLWFPGEAFLFSLLTYQCATTNDLVNRSSPEVITSWYTPFARF